MGLLIGLAVFLVVLSRVGRLGPFVWDPDWRTRALPAGRAARQDHAEAILAGRLADGSLGTDDYYERLNLLRSR